MDNGSFSLGLNGDGELKPEGHAREVIADIVKAIRSDCICPIGEYEVGVAIMLIPTDAPPDRDKMRKYAEWVYLRVRTEPTKPISIPEAKAIEARGELPFIGYAILTIRSEGEALEVYCRDDVVPFLTQAATALERVMQSPVQVEDVVAVLCATFPPGTYILGRDIDLTNPRTLESLASNIRNMNRDLGSLPEVERSEEEDDE